MTTRTERIRSILADHLGMSQDKILLDSNLGGDLGADSLDLDEIPQLLEEEFDIPGSILVEDWERIETVLDIDNLVERLQAEPEQLAMKHERVEIVKCPCGDSICSTYGLSEGMFYQGSGWDKETAERMAAAWNATLSISTEALQSGPDDWIHSYITELKQALIRS